jgi:hypothetical protein
MGRMDWTVNKDFLAEMAKMVYMVGMVRMGRMDCKDLLVLSHGTNGEILSSHLNFPTEPSDEK